MKRKIEMVNKNAQSKVFEHTEPQNIREMISKISEKKEIYEDNKINVEFIRV